MPTTGEEQIGAREKKIHAAFVDHLDALDDRERGAMRRGVGGIEDEIVGGLDVVGREGRAVAEDVWRIV
jgi:hypothetical protein